jgi:hypothetical protein
MEALDGNYVPQPFEPVAVKGNTLSVWARDYDFSGKGILDQVTVKNEKLLRKRFCRDTQKGAAYAAPVGITFSASSDTRSPWQRPAW